MNELWVIWWYALSPMKATNKSLILFVLERRVHPWKKKRQNSSKGGVSNDEKECLTHKQSTDLNWGGEIRKETVGSKKRLIRSGSKQDRRSEKWALLFAAALTVRRVWKMTTGLQFHIHYCHLVLNKMCKSCRENEGVSGKFSLIYKVMHNFVSATILHNLMTW